jgi:hypothetical protein
MKPKYGGRLGSALPPSTSNGCKRCFLPTSMGDRWRTKHVVAWLSCVRAVPTHSYSVPDQPVCLTMGDVMLGGTMGVVMLGRNWLAQ